MVHEALQAQTAAIAALTEELKLSREAGREKPEPKPRPEGGGEDSEPGKSIPWYYR
jgi:hypothetical protein